MNANPFTRALAFSTLVFISFSPSPSTAASAQVLGWNNLGMHCMDSDYSVFSILPPYNTIECQLIASGTLITNGTGYTVTYQAVADPDGSFNSTAMGKGNYYTYATTLYGAVLAPDAGLAGWSMPGVSNTPQAMLFETTNVPAAIAAAKVNWFRAEGIPLSPYDDAHQKNPYPLMRLIAKSGSTPIATNDIVLPVSDEMDCRACHASGTQAAAQPAAGWVWDGLPERDFRLNILRLHDEHEFASHAALYTAALAARGFNPQGLYRGVVADNQPVLCATCHASEALGKPSFGTIPQLTTSVHSYHAHVMDPELHITLDNSANRAACYRCHPGSTTKCLRGAMGGAIAQDGSMEMQCQSCHGNLSQVGATGRTGWFEEPNCQACHSGTAANNSGQIRYTSAFTDTNGTMRLPADRTFATQTNTPAAGISLYRFSAGHGGLQCSACHGSTHAEFPSTHRNDNLASQRMQGHSGVTVECTACHATSPSTVTGGPHGMHPVGQTWVSDHQGAAEGNRIQCQACHGTDYRGTVLSRMQADRTLSAFGTKTLFRGAIVGCYTCHNGPTSESANNSTPPSVANATNSLLNSATAVITLPVTGVGPGALRLISQPANGSIGLDTNTGAATYFPNPGFVGTDTFTFAAYDGAKNSNLGTGTVMVAQGSYSIGATAHVPPTYPVGWPAAFGVVPVVTNHAAPATFAWDFGDGSALSTNQSATHAYGLPGNYSWRVVSTVAGASVTNSGTIAISSTMSVSAINAGGTLTLAWPRTLADAVLEASPALGALSQWSATTNGVTANLATYSVTIPNPVGNAFFRLRQVQ